MEYSLRYRSSRPEVWRWYWATWRRSFWMLHAMIAILIGVICADNFAHPPSMVAMVMYPLLVFPLVVGLLAAYPQIMFKPQERHLVVNESGWTTTIGDKSGSASWADISEVAEGSDALVIRGAGGAMIIPSRVLPRERWPQFVADVREWHRGNVV